MRYGHTVFSRRDVSWLFRPRALGVPRREPLVLASRSPTPGTNPGSPYQLEHRSSRCGAYRPAYPLRYERVMCGSGLSTACPSPTPRGLGLGPPTPPRSARAAEPSGFRWGGFSPPESLLIPAFALGSPPRRACAAASSAMLRSPTARPKAEPKASVDSLSPVGLSVQANSTSELLRTLSRVAASKPTSWLSGPAHRLAH